MVCFDAKAIFCPFCCVPPSTSQDDNFMFHGNYPLSPPTAQLNHIGDINTSQGYIQTYNNLIKIPNEEILLPCILAMDKTQCDTYSRLAIEPRIVVSYGLMKHSIRSQPVAMRVLGYINHEALHKTDVEDNEVSNVHNNCLMNAQRVPQNVDNYPRSCYHSTTPQHPQNIQHLLLL